MTEPKQVEGNPANGPDPIARLIQKDEITSYLYKLCLLLDEFEIEKFVEEFTDDGTYKLIPRENYAKNLPVAIIDDNKDRLIYRSGLILRHWQYEKFRENRLLSNIQFEFPSVDESRTTSTIAIYQTNEEGATAFHLTGVLMDTIVRRDGRWRIKDRLAILDTFLPTETLVLPP